MIPRAVFDCMVFLQAAGRPNGPARACFHLVEAGHIDLCLSAEILAEVRDVLARPKSLQRFPLLQGEWPASFLQSIEQISNTFENVQSAFAFERDPKDEPYLNLAIAADADFLVSRDKDLLDLMNDPAFCLRYPRLKIVDPVEFLRSMPRPPYPEQMP